MLWQTDAPRSPARRDGTQCAACPIANVIGYAAKEYIAVRKMVSVRFGPFLPRWRRGGEIDASDLPPDVEEVMRTLGVERTTRRYLLYVALPLWIAAGLLDWDRHRRTKKAIDTGAPRE